MTAINPPCDLRGMRKPSDITEREKKEASSNMHNELPASWGSGWTREEETPSRDVSAIAGMLRGGVGRSSPPQRTSDAPNWGGMGGAQQRRNGAPSAARRLAGNRPATKASVPRVGRGMRIRS